jgi:hypothetical protein
MEFTKFELEQMSLLPQLDNHIPAHEIVDWKDDHNGYMSSNTMSPPNFPQVEEVMDDYFPTTRMSTRNEFEPIMLEVDELAEQSHSSLNGDLDYCATYCNGAPHVGKHAIAFNTVGWHRVSNDHRPPLHTSDPIILELDEMLEASRTHSDLSANAQEATIQDAGTLQTPSSAQWVSGGTLKRGKHGSTAMPIPFNTANQTRAQVLTAPMLDPSCSDVLLHQNSPMSQEELIAEIKASYTIILRLASVFNNRINAYVKTICEGASCTSTEHWPSLTALHSTLLHKHHDFFLATQHPSASPALRQLASKYAMPTRMWKNGIQPILELFRLNLDGRTGHVQDFLRDTRHTLKMFQENLPGMVDDWNKMEAALLEFENVVYDLRNDVPYNPPQSGSSLTDTTSRPLSYLQHLHARTRPQDEKQSDGDPDYGDVFISDLPTIPPDQRHEEICFPQRVTDTLMAWMIMGQAICWDSFNIFAKVFALLSIAAWKLHIPLTLF